MTNPHKAKGTAWETAVVNYLISEGIDARRVVQTGRADQGDIHAGGAWCIEAKDHKAHDFPGYIRQANSEATNAKLSYGVAVVKKRRDNVKNAYVVLDLETFARWVRDSR